MLIRFLHENPEEVPGGFLTDVNHVNYSQLNVLCLMCIIGFIDGC